MTDHEKATADHMRSAVFFSDRIGIGLQKQCDAVGKHDEAGYTGCEQVQNAGTGFPFRKLMCAKRTQTPA